MAQKDIPKISIRRRVILFSLFFFLVIMAGGVTAFLFSMRQIVHNNAAGELLRVVETRKIQFEGSFNSQISLAVKMADSPLIRDYFKNPRDKELERLAMQEFAAYRRAFSGGNIFWINDTDRRYYFGDEYVYTLDPADSESDWYLPALNMSGRFAFNVNYDAGIKKTLCWINVPVYDSGGKAIGICGTGIDLTDYISILFSGYDSGISLFLFNEAGEITGARNIALMEQKMPIGQYLGDAGIMAEREGKKLSGEDITSFTIGNTECAIGRIARLNWYIAAVTPITPVMLYFNAMSAVFGIILFVIFLIFFIFNIYIQNVLRPINSMLDMGRLLSARWSKTSKRLDVQQMIFVFLAFTLMVIISWTAASFILKRHLTFEAVELLRNGDLAIQSNLREPETTMANTVFAVNELLRHGADLEAVHNYFINMTTQFMDSDDAIYGFNGVYGVLYGEYIDGERWVPPAGYVPEERPWYIAAVNAGKATAVTQPYVDAQTGEVVLSYSHQLFGEDGAAIGVISLDVSLNRVAEYAESLKLAEGGYGLLLNSNFEIFAHPRAEFLGLNYAALSEADAQITALLREGKSVNAFEKINGDGDREIVFFTKTTSGWYLGLVTPSRLYYSDINTMVIVLCIVGSVLMAGLMMLLYSLQKRVEISTNAVMELNKSTIRFVPTQFMEFLEVNDITKMNLGDCKKGDITIMFFDVRFFSIHSQIMSLTENFEFINRVFGLSGPIIRDHGGFVDKYLGDAVMALFEKSADAVRAGIAVYHSLILNEDSRIRVGMDRINIGIGLHTGSVMLGIIGDTQRLSSTVISENVNMASRIEGLTKQVKAGMLISADVMRDIDESERDFAYRYLGLVQPAATNDIIGIFEILDALPYETRQKRTATKAVFESGVRNFHTKDYKTAWGRFREVLKLDNTDECAKRYLAEAERHYRDNSLPSVFMFDVK